MKPHFRFSNGRWLLSSGEPFHMRGEGETVQEAWNTSTFRNPWSIWASPYLASLGNQIWQPATWEPSLHPSTTTPPQDTSG